MEEETWTAALELVLVVLWVGLVLLPIALVRKLLGLGEH